MLAIEPDVSAVDLHPHEASVRDLEDLERKCNVLDVQGGGLGLALCVGVGLEYRAGSHGCRDLALCESPHRRHEQRPSDQKLCLEHSLSLLRRVTKCKSEW